MSKAFFVNVNKEDGRERERERERERRLQSAVQYFVGQRLPVASLRMSFKRAR